MSNLKRSLKFLRRVQDKLLNLEHDYEGKVKGNIYHGRLNQIYRKTKYYEDFIENFNVRSINIIEGRMVDINDVEHGFSILLDSDINIEDATLLIEYKTGNKVTLITCRRPQVITGKINITKEPIKNYFLDSLEN